MLRYSKGVLLFTDEGIKLLGLKSTGKPWTVEECFRKCNSLNNEFDNRLRANQLKIRAALFNANTKKEKDWYKDKNNFREVGISVESVIGRKMT